MVDNSLTLSAELNSWLEDEKNSLFPTRFLYLESQHALHFIKCDNTISLEKLPIFQSILMENNCNRYAKQISLSSYLMRS